MNRKILAVFLSLGLILTACSENTDTNDNEVVESFEQEEIKEEPKEEKNYQMKQEQLSM